MEQYISPKSPEYLDLVDKIKNQNKSKCFDLTELSRHPWLASEDPAIEDEKRALFDN